MAFVLHFPIVIPCLIERVVTYFNVCSLSYSLKEHEAINITDLRKKRKEKKNSFSCSSWKYLIFVVVVLVVVFVLD